MQRKYVESYGDHDDVIFDGPHQHETLRETPATHFLKILIRGYSDEYFSLNSTVDKRNIEKLIDFYVRSIFPYGRYVQWDEEQSKYFLLQGNEVPHMIAKYFLKLKSENNDKKPKAKNTNHSKEGSNKNMVKKKEERHIEKNTHRTKKKNQDGVVEEEKKTMDIPQHVQDDKEEQKQRFFQDVARFVPQQDVAVPNNDQLNQDQSIIQDKDNSNGLIDFGSFQSSLEESLEEAMEKPDVGYEIDLIQASQEEFEKYLNQS